MKLCCFQYSVLFHVRCTCDMIDMRYHELLDLTETVRNEPILSGSDIDNIKATKLIMGHHIIACEEFYVHNNIVIYLERKKTVPEPDFLQYGFLQHHTTPHTNALILIDLLKCNRL